MSNYYPTFAASNCRNGAAYWEQPQQQQQAWAGASGPAGYRANDPRIHQLVVERGSGTRRRSEESETTQTSAIEIPQNVELFTPHPTRQCIMPYPKERNEKYFLVPTSSIKKENLPDGTMILPQGSQYYLKEQGERCARPFEAGVEYAVLAEGDYASANGEPKARFRRSNPQYSYTWRPLAYRLFRHAPSTQQSQIRQSWNYGAQQSRPQPAQAYQPYYWQRSGI